MKNPQGVIVKISRHDLGLRAIVEVEAEAVCARCASGRGCGAGIFAARQGIRHLDVPIDADAGLAEGDIVGLELAPGNVLLAAAIVYGLPLGGAAIAAALAYGLALGDGGAALMALVGLAAGALGGRFWLKDRACLSRLTPTVSRPTVAGRLIA